jgi:hypothetical protein
MPTHGEHAVCADEGDLLRPAGKSALSLSIPRHKNIPLPI